MMGHSIPPLWLLPFNAVRFTVESVLPVSPHVVDPALWDLNAVANDWKQPDPQGEWKKREAYLLQAYPLLETLLPQGAHWVRLESLQHLHWLDAHLSSKIHVATPAWLREGEIIRGLDVGSKQWAYAPGQLAWLQGCVDSATETVRPNSVCWDGIELDAKRRYSLSTARLNYAKGIEALAPQYLRYICGNALQHAVSQPYHVIVQSLPFVVPDPHLHWGLPWQTYQPLALLRHLIETLLCDGGYLFISNLTTAEMNEQERLLTEVAVLLAPSIQLEIQKITTLGESFIRSEYQRGGWIVKKSVALKTLRARAV